MTVSQSSRFDNSQIQVFKNCPEQYRLQYRYRRDESGVWFGLAKPDHAVEDHHHAFGSAVHAGLKVFYLRGGWSDIKKAFQDAYPVQLDFSDKAKTPENGVVLLDRYIKRYGDQDKHMEIVDVEVAQEFELYPGVRFTVKMDLVMRQQGCLYFMDHKTTKMASGIEARYWTQFEPNSAITAYTAFCLQRYGECSGGIINALGLGYIEKPQLFDPEDANRGWEIYANQELKFSKYYGKDMMYASGFKADFQRNVFNRNEEQVRAWREDTLRWIDKVKQEEYAFESSRNVPDQELKLANRYATKQWTKNEAQCRFCNFREICINCGDEQIIEAMYVEQDNTKYLEEK